MAQQKTTTESEQTSTVAKFERAEGRRAVIYVGIAIVVILVLGFLAGVLDNAIRSAGSNAFVENSREILVVVASTAPWIAFFLILCTSWIFVADQLFMRWNRALGRPDEQDKGLIYEIVHDNNAAAALVLFVPMLIIAMGLLYVALLNLPYNLSTYITTVQPK